MEKINYTGIIILNYNNSIDTINCINSVEHFNTSPIKYIIVDNGSTCSDVVEEIDSFLEKKIGTEYVKVSNEKNVVNFLPKACFFISPTNDGYAQGNNKGLMIAEKDTTITDILILNNDILFTEDIIPKLKEIRHDMISPGIISPLLLKKDGKSIDYTCARKDYTHIQLFFQYLFFFIDIFGLLSFFSKKQNLLENNPNLLSSKYFEIEMPSGSCMLIDKLLFKHIGYFDTHTFLYFEENILFRKMEKIGKHNYLVPWLNCVHLGASTSKKSPTFFTMKCHIESNEYYLRNYNSSIFLEFFISNIKHLIMLKIKVLNYLRK